MYFLEQSLQQKSEEFVALEQKMQLAMFQKDREQRQLEVENRQSVENARKLKGILSEVRQRYCAEIYDLRQGTYTHFQYIVSTHLPQTCHIKAFLNFSTYTLPHNERYTRWTGY